MAANVARCESSISYRFSDQHLGWEALQMAGNGVLKSGDRVFLNGNKRLAILGGFVLSLLLSQDWYGSDAVEGLWDQKRQQITSNANLAAVGNDRALEECIQLGNGQGKVSMKMMATTVEAIIGAAYLDGGEAAARSVMQSLGIVYPV